MGFLKLLTDVRIAKNRRRHILVTPDDKDVTWHETVAGAIEAALDQGFDRLLLVGDVCSYELKVTRLPDGGTIG